MFEQVWVGSDDGPMGALVTTLMWGRPPFVDDGSEVKVWGCQDCGGVVVDWPTHERWHARLERMMSGG